MDRDTAARTRPGTATGSTTTTTRAGATASDAAASAGSGIRIPAQRRPVDGPPPAPPLDTEAVLRRFATAWRITQRPYSAPSADATRNPEGSGGAASLPDGSVALTEPPHLSLRTYVLTRARLTLTGVLHHPAPPTPAHTHAWDTARRLLLECALAEAWENAPDPATAARRAARVAHTLTTPPPTNYQLPYPSHEAEELWYEQRRLARELHDQITAPLTQALRHLEPGTPDEDPNRVGDTEGDTEEKTEGKAEGRTAAATGLSRAQDLIQEALHASRALTHNFNQHTTLPPLAEALRAFVTHTAPPHITTTIATTGNEQLLSGAARRELFLAIRETLHNCFEHAGTDRITITTRTTRRWAHARIEDHGQGFTPTTPLAPHHQGLRAVTERIQDIGGRLTIDAAPLEGTRTDIHIPLTLHTAA
ncbi:sensor histidine kinase [Streptomyces sp. ISL-11]|uniref:sensor histidine kinase n=1 Tax=Streptomyces sp. ISL-11 TaxID=2819174 RepID=UPI001BEB27D5|nr:ATP-binding protein [Streptomyces sp. ISL-11]MBT2387338.1 hypothetical protein [Streptomyces sp. ISL-11]